MRFGQPIIVGVVMAMLVLSSCAGERHSARAVFTNQPQTTSTLGAEIAGTTVTPAPSVTVARQPSPTSLAPASPTPIAVATAPGPAEDGGADSRQPAPTATASPTLPPPTFTPPPLPPPDPADHYILSRPVPAGSQQWTDKAYPYGSTRGGTLQVHHGVEFAVPAGTPVLAALSGTVRFAGSDESSVVGPQPDFYGQVVVLEHETSSPLFTVYGHLSEIVVETGQPVKTGELLGFSGDSGVAYGPHLHFEVRQGENLYSTTRNPLLWLRPFPGYGTVVARVTWPDGQPVLEAPVILRRVDGTAPYTAGTTYAAGGINGDDLRQENLVLDDVVPGYYELSIASGDIRVTENVWVFPDRTSSLEITIR